MAKSKQSIKPLLPDEKVISKIYVIREQKVMLDRDLAEMYGVETKMFNRQVKRNIERFPEGFMFQLTSEEFENLRSQNATSSWGGQRYLPMVFTEQGVAMLSSVLRSDTAIKVNIQIIRIFTQIRKLVLSNKDILLKLEQLEKTSNVQGDEIRLIFKHLKQLINPPQVKRERIGFKHYDV